MLEVTDYLTFPYITDRGEKVGAGFEHRASITPAHG